MKNCRTLCVCVCPVCVQKGKYACVCMCPEYVRKDVYKKLLTEVISGKRKLASRGIGRTGKELFIFIYSPLFYLIFTMCMYYFYN